MTTRTETGEEVAAPITVDRHPTTLIAPDGRAWTKVRVVVTDGETFVYEERRDGYGRGHVSTALRLKHGPIRPDGGRWLIEAEDGTWTLMPESGCRCGSALGHLPTPIPADLVDYVH